MKALSEKTQLLLLIILTAITRIPFIFDGYGVEEDSWGLVVNAFEMKQTGHYVASRFPGHPLQEYVYRLIYDQPAWVYNSFSMLAGIIAVAFFFKALKKIQLKGAFAASLMFCFTPVFYIAGTYTIDFAWTVAFVMVSFYYLLDRKFILSGIMLGMATGCRLTSEIFLLPWLIILWNTFDWKSSVKDLMKVAVPAVVIGILWFVPAYLVYERSFFDYSDQFPYPSLAKVIYKASIGVFGLTGMIALCIYGIVSLNTWRKKELNPVTLFSSERLLLVCAVVIGLHI
ncbi:MAG: glycosyltransferase 87 family protein, partial [Bacteroidota bacterium]|nr:glycosyltransferase 87 family protein [Bacteroidota bacterium]